jgi:hypothetical protein
MQICYHPRRRRLALGMPLVIDCTHALQRDAWRTQATGTETAGSNPCDNLAFPHILLDVHPDGGIEEKRGWGVVITLTLSTVSSMAKLGTPSAPVIQPLLRYWWRAVLHCIPDGTRIVKSCLSAQMRCLLYME